MTSDPRETLAEFLQRELEAWRDAGKARSAREWAAKVKLPPQPVHRALRGENMRLTQLQEFAEALKCEPWQLLFPGYVRGSPVFPTMSEEAISVALELDRIEDEQRRKQYAAGFLTVLGQPPAAPAAPAAAPVAPPSPAAGPTRAPARHR